MINTAESYGQALFDLDIRRDVIRESKRLMEGNPELVQALISPNVTHEEKHKVIDRLFPDEVKNFFKVLCDNGRMSEIHQIDKVYEEYRLKNGNIIQAELIYANKLNPGQIEALKQTITKKYKKAGVKLTVTRDPCLLGGFILRVGDEVYDRSVKGKLSRIHRQLAWR